jgi:hypothetical protein
MMIELAEKGCGELRTTDPMERIIEAALLRAGYDYSVEGEEGQTLDFYVPKLGCFIEVKRFHSDRIARQMANVPNIIVAQGRHAVEMLAALIGDMGAMQRELDLTVNELVALRARATQEEVRG